VKAQELSRKYATAIFSLALEKWLTPLGAVNDKLNDSPALIKALQASDQSFAERQKKLDDLIPTDAEQPVRNFLYTLLEKNDINLLDQVLSTLEQMSRGGPQVQVAQVTTAVELGSEERAKFQESLRAKFGQNLEFTFRTDPSILGGAVVQVGDKVIDGSVASQLDALNNALGVKR